MNKYFIVWIIFSLSILLSYSCKKDDDNPSDQNNFEAFFWVFHYDDASFITNEDNSSATIFNGATITGDPIPELISFSFGDIIYEGVDFVGHNEGLINVAHPIAYVTSNYDLLKIEINTSVGTIKGTEELPGTVENFSINYTDTLPKGESLILSWEGEGSDFYEIIVICAVDSGNGFYTGESIRVHTKEHSYEFEYSVFEDSKFLDTFIVLPYNGPLPNQSIESNMSGDGIGYLYYGRVGYGLATRIIVGKE